MTDSTTDLLDPIPADDDIKGFCDWALTSSARLMVGKGASIEMILDRALTFAAAHAVSIDGAEQTAKVFRQLADTIEGGKFDRFEPDRRGKGH